MCDCTRVDKPIQGSQAAQPVNHGHSTFVYTKPAQAPERYRNFDPLGVQKDAGFSRFTPMPISLRELDLSAIGIYFQIAAENKPEGMSVNHLKTTYKYEDSSTVDDSISQLIESGYIRAEYRNNEAFLFVAVLENEEVSR